MAATPSPATSKRRRKLTGCLALFLVPLAALLLLAGWLDRRSQRDDDAARRFCAQVEVGEPLEEVVARAHALPDAPNVTVWSDELAVTWANGMWMHAATCRAESVDGRITSTQVRIADN
jgi:hypothetical protein